MGGYLSAVRGDANTEIELITLPPTPTYHQSSRMHLDIPASENLENEPNVVTRYEDGESDRNQGEEFISMPPSNPFVVGEWYFVFSTSPQGHIHIDILEDLDAVEQTIVAGSQNDGSEPPVRNEQGSISVITPSNPFVARSHGFPEIWHLVMMVMIPASLEFAALKFENKNKTAFQTHPVFANMAIASFFIVISSSIRLVYVKDGPTKERTILKALICISWVFLAVSIAMVFIPPHLIWIGYLSIGVLLGAIASHCRTRLFGKKDGSTSETSHNDV